MACARHPGEILQVQYLEPLNLIARTLANEIGVPASRLTEIIAGRQGVTADTAIRLGRYFGMDPRFWLNLQMTHDLSVAEAATDYTHVSRRAVPPVA